MLTFDANAVYAAVSRRYEPQIRPVTMETPRAAPGGYWVKSAIRMYGGGDDVSCRIMARRRYASDRDVFVPPDAEIYREDDTYTQCYVFVRYHETKLQ